MATCSFTPDCSGWPYECAKAQPDPDIAGIGVMVSFVLTAAITLAASIAGLLLRPPSDVAHLPSLDPRGNVNYTYLPRSNTGRNDESSDGLPISIRDRQLVARRRMWSNILDRLVLSLSDQQLASCFAILTTALIRSCKISLYHLDTVCDLAWFSTITHLLSIIVLRHYWLQDSKQLALYVRSVLIVSALAMLLYVVSTLVVAGGIGGCLAICVFYEPDQSYNFGGLEIFATAVDACIVLWVYPTTGLFVFPLWFKFYHFFMWELPSRFFAMVGLSTISANSAQDSIKGFRKGSHIIAYAYRGLFFPSQSVAIVCQVVIWCLRLFLLVWDRLDGPSSVTDPNAELEWSFGQLLAVIIVFLPFLTLLETWSEYSKSAITEQENIALHPDDPMDQSMPMKTIRRISTEQSSIRRRKSM